MFIATLVGRLAYDPTVVVAAQFLDPLSLGGGTKNGCLIAPLVSVLHAIASPPSSPAAARLRC